MSTMILWLVLCLDILILWWWVNRKLNTEEEQHSYNLHVYNNDGSFKRVEGLPDMFAAVESAEECFGYGAQKVILSENGYMKRLFTREDYEAGLCV